MAEDFRIKILGIMWDVKVVDGKVPLDLKLCGKEDFLSNTIYVDTQYKYDMRVKTYI